MSGGRVQAATTEAVLRRSANLDWVDVGGEAVVWHRDHEQLHRLDRIGTLVFHLCDGVTPLGVTMRELGEAFDAVGHVEGDVQELVTALLRSGVLEHV